jgi:hypothetical protein
MATFSQIVGSRTSLTVTGLSTLASATYVASANYNCSANDPLDVIVELDATTTNSPTGNKQLLVFLIESLDGTNYRSGPTSGTTATDEPNLLLLGVLPMNSASVAQIGTFSVLQRLGYVPRDFKVIIKNDLGVALTSGTCFTAEISGTVA